MKVTIVDYAKMTLKELEREHTKQNQILLDMINDGRYSKKDIEFQKSTVDYIYKKISMKHQIINNTVGF